MISVIDLVLSVGVVFVWVVSLILSILYSRWVRRQESDSMLTWFLEELEDLHEQRRLELIQMIRDKLDATDYIENRIQKRKKERGE